ncbi:MAG: flagellar biosynthesis anti-sigma factor FlgM [Spirochaetaceae bacterium]|nr:MAG: flagellar biosynthesis anti-sigma factor FlgM [Spirochaetaceae bacterium]
MTIERLGPVDPIQKYNKSEKVARPDARNSGDSISVSDEAKIRSEIMQAVEQVRSLPDIREDRVAEIREKLRDPSYISDRVVEAVAEELISVFEIG